MGRQIMVEIVGDASKFDAATRDATSKGHSFGGALKAVAVAGAIVAGATVVAGVGIYKMGSQFEAMDAKAKTVFGGQIGLVQEWAKANAGAMGLTAREATGLAANMGDLLVPMGFTRAEAASMSTEMVGLSGALSEWSGGTKSAAEVSASLQKALLGEREELKGLGISITEADVSARLLADGKSKLTGAALAQAKAEATMALILEKSTDAQNAYEAGTAKGLRTQAEMNARLKEVGETIITGLYPAVSTVAGFLATNLPAAIAFAQTAFANISAAVGPIITQAMPGLRAAFATITTQVIPAIGAAFSWFGKNILPIIGQAVGFIATSVVPKLAAAFDWISKNVLPAVGAAFSFLAKNVFPIIAAAINVIVNTILPALARAFDWVSKNILPILGAALRVVGTVFSTVFNAVRAVVTAVMSAIGGTINTHRAGIQTAFAIIGVVLRTVGGVFSAVFAAIGNVIRTAGSVISTVAGTIGRIFGGIGDAIRNLQTRISLVVSGILSAIGAMPGRIASIARGMWDGIWNGFRSVVNSIIRGWNSISFSVPRVDLGPLGSVGGFSIGTPNIGYLHTGGIVPGVPGSNVLTVLQAGEEVRSRMNARGGGDVHVHIHGNVYGGPPGLDELAAQLSARIRLSGYTRG
jgi:hypothetical protein